MVYVNHEHEQMKRKPWTNSSMVNACAAEENHQKLPNQSGDRLCVSSSDIFQF